MERPLVAAQRNEGCLGNRAPPSMGPSACSGGDGGGAEGVTKCRFQAVSHSEGRSQPLKSAWQAK